MKYIEIAQGISVKKECIVAITSIGELETEILLENGESFTTSFPYMTLLQLLEQEQPDKEEILLREVSQKIGNIGNFAG